MFLCKIVSFFSFYLVFFSNKNYVCLCVFVNNWPVDCLTNFFFIVPNFIYMCNFKCTLHNIVYSIFFCYDSMCRIFCVCILFCFPLYLNWSLSKTNSFQCINAWFFSFSHKITIFTQINWNSLMIFISGQFFVLILTHTNLYANIRESFFFTLIHPNV